MSQLKFLDTGFLLALIRKDDQYHHAAVAGAGIYSGPYITTELILLEFATALSSPPHRKTATAVIQRILSDKDTEVVPWHTLEFQKVFTLYEERMDKSWGIVDCFSFLIMQQRKVNTALAFDIHFKQAGFHVQHSPSPQGDGTFSPGRSPGENC